MTVAIPVVRTISLMSQLQQMGRSLGSILHTFCEKTETAFQRVIISKINERGDVKTYVEKDPRTGEDRQISQLSYIEEIKTGNIYLDEEMHVISLKCAALVLAVPLYTFVVMQWHLVKVAFEITAIGLNAIQTAASSLLAGNFSESRLSISSASGMLTSLTSEAFEIVKAPFFGLGMQLAVLYGIFRPLQGRVAAASIENAWQNGASYKGITPHVPERNESCLQTFIKDLQCLQPLYLARCFQVRGNLSDARIRLIERKNLY